MIKSNNTFQIKKHNRKFTRTYQKKRTKNYRFQYRGANSVFQPYEFIIFA